MKFSSTHTLLVGAFGVLIIAAVLLSGIGTNRESVREANCDLTIVMTGVNSDQGFIRGLLCKENERFPNSCAISKEVKAAKGTVELHFDQLPNDNYAFAAYHDENDDGKINMSGDQIPSEGLFFSKNTMGQMGPPRFSQSAFELCENNKVLVQSRYLGQ